MQVFRLACVPLAHNLAFETSSLVMLFRFVLFGYFILATLLPFDFFRFNDKPFIENLFANSLRSGFHLSV